MWDERVRHIPEDPKVPHDDPQDVITNHIRTETLETVVEYAMTAIEEYHLVIPTDVVNEVITHPVERTCQHYGINLDDGDDNGH